MKRWIICTCVAVGFAAMLLAAQALVVRPVQAQSVPGTGISSLVCVLNVNGSGTYGQLNGPVYIEVTDNGASSPDWVGTADVTVHHGQSSSEHLLTYQDVDESGSLNCGDGIISIQ